MNPAELVYLAGLLQGVGTDNADFRALPTVPEGIYDSSGTYVSIVRAVQPDADELLRRIREGKPLGDLGQELSQTPPSPANIVVSVVDRNGSSVARQRVRHPDRRRVQRVARRHRPHGGPTADEGLDDPVSRGRGTDGRGRGNVLRQPRLVPAPPGTLPTTGRTSRSSWAGTRSSAEHERTRGVPELTSAYGRRASAASRARTRPRARTVGGRGPGRSGSSSTDRRRAGSAGVRVQPARVGGHEEVLARDDLESRGAVRPRHDGETAGERVQHLHLRSRAAHADVDEASGSRVEDLVVRDRPRELGATALVDPTDHPLGAPDPATTSRASGTCSSSVRKSSRMNRESPRRSAATRASRGTAGRDRPVGSAPGARAAPDPRRWGAGRSRAPPGRAWPAPRSRSDTANTTSNRGSRPASYRRTRRASTRTRERRSAWVSSSVWRRHITCSALCSWSSRRPANIRDVLGHQPAVDEDRVVAPRGDGSETRSVISGLRFRSMLSGTRSA